MSGRSKPSSRGPGRKKSAPLRTPQGHVVRGPSRAAVQEALEVLRGVPPLDPYVTGYSIKARHQQLEKPRQSLLKLASAIDHALLAIAPQLQVPSPVGCSAWQSGIGTPYSNLLRCTEFCPACMGEAVVVLDSLLDARRFEAVLRTTFAPELLAARIAHNDEWERRYRADRKNAPRFVSWVEQGKLYVTMTSGPPTDIDNLGTQEVHVLETLRRVYPERLITAEIAKRTGRAGKGLGPVLVLLKSIGLIDNMPRRGYAATPKGIDALNCRRRRSR